MLIVTSLMVTVWAQALNYLQRPPYVPHSVAYDLGIRQECLGFLHYPDPYATLGLAQPLPAALDMGLMPGRRLVWAARRRAMRCWHADKLRLSHQKSGDTGSERHRLISAEVADAVWKLNTGRGGVPSLLHFPLTTERDARENSGRAEWVHLSQWFRTPLPPHRIPSPSTRKSSLLASPKCSLPHFAPTCLSQCTLDAALAQLSRELTTRYWRLPTTPTTAALYNHTGCPRCTLSLAIAPYTAFLAPAISVGWFRVDLHLFNPHALPPPLAHDFWRSLELDNYARESWFWWAVRRYGTHGLHGKYLDDAEAATIRGWTLADRIQLVREGWYEPRYMALTYNAWMAGYADVDASDEKEWLAFVDEYNSEAAHRAVDEMTWVHDMACALDQEEVLRGGPCE